MAYTKVIVINRIYNFVLNPFEIIIRFTFLNPSLTTRLIQKFVQNIIFLLLLALLTKVLQE
jgi:hypothetical protein